KMVGDPLKGVTGLGVTYAYMGDRDKAMEYIKIMDQRVKRDKDITLNGDYLLIYNALGNFEKALEHLEDGIKRGESIFFVRINPFFEKFREDERYLELLNKYFES
ncbi:MAG: hypothetical protein R3250_11760, partial [Melioribacteraceae bacterium]|nr:hypothetical protein [Melioribacteraceae bacterium]